MFLKISVLIVLLTISFYAISSDLEIYNIRVGQGDATLIKGPSDSSGNTINVLFDAGNIRGIDGGHVLKTIFYKHDVKHLDYVVISHYDADHIGGIVSGGAHGDSVLLGWNKVPGLSGDDDGDGDVDWIGTKNYKPDPDELGQGDDIPVGTFIDRGDDNPPTSKAYKKYKLMAEAKDNRVSLDSLSEVQNHEIDLGGGAKLITLASDGYVRGKDTRIDKVNDENERSISMLLSYNKFHYLISGDLTGGRWFSIDADVESAVADYIDANNIIVDVLHVNHHGSNTSSSLDFLKKIKPTIAVISAGNGNHYTHPYDSVLDRLDEAKVYRIVQTSWGSTNKIPDKIRKIHSVYQNDVVIRSDGSSFIVSTERKFKADSNPRRPDND
jgi:beta-lactamase superfamily II metal-dependent hydrolase